jgi:uncharacterized protein
MRQPIRQEPGRETVLIAGGSGFIGSNLAVLLKKEGFNVAILTRAKPEIKGIKAYQWDTGSGFIEEGAIENADYLVNLAGANVGTKPWTANRKRIIEQSRLDSTDLLCSTLKHRKNKIKAFIAASGTGYYGDCGDKWMEEDASNANDFLGKLCVRWELANQRIEKAGFRTCIIRTGIVLGKEGALPRFSRLVNFYLGAPVGNGNQYMSWIHIEDICRLYLECIRNREMSGIYNGVSPNPVTNTEFMNTLGKVLDKPIFFPPVPAFILRLFMGERASLALDGCRVSARRLIKKGFLFGYPTLTDALEEIYSSHD